MYLCTDSVIWSLSILLTGNDPHTDSLWIVMLSSASMQSSWFYLSYQSLHQWQYTENSLKDKVPLITHWNFCMYTFLFFNNCYCYLPTNEKLHVPDCDRLWETLRTPLMLSVVTNSCVVHPRVSERLYVLDSYNVINPTLGLGWLMWLLVNILTIYYRDSTSQVAVSKPLCIQTVWSQYVWEGCGFLCTILFMLPSSMKLVPFELD